MTRTTFKEKSMKKQSLDTKEVANRQHQYPGRPIHTHNPPSNFPHQNEQKKGGCTRLFKEHQRVYVTFGQKPSYVHDFQSKTCVYREESGKKKAKGQTNLGKCQWMNILLNVTQKQGEIEKSENYKHIQCQKPPKKKNQEPPQYGHQFCYGENSYGLGCITIDSQTREINPFPYVRETKYLTLRDIKLYLVSEG